MGVAIAALGSVAGGLAAQKLMGKSTTYGPDTSVPGVSSATIKKGGKGQPDEKVPQVDISQSLAWFKQSADTQAAYYQQGLNYYNDALKQAAVQINEGYKSANETLQPLSFSSNQALNEQMRMMGLDPISSSVNAASHAAEVGLDGNIQKQIADAEKIKDPTQRAAAKQNIMSSINSYTSALQGMTDAQGNAVKGLAGPGLITGTPFNPADHPDIGGVMDITDVTHGGDMKVSAADMAKLKAAGAVDAGETSLYVNPSIIASFNNNTQKVYDQQKQSILAQQDKLNAQIKTVQDFTNSYDQSYSDQYDAGYTGDQVSAKIAATPGYQFQMDQGTKAIERQGAAAGMLGSGNTLTALTNYGQGLAQNFYGVYMDNLAKIVNQGSGATQQIAQNQINQGKDYGALIEAGGQAGMQTSQLTGQAYGAYLDNSAKLYSDAAQFNASMQYQGMNAAQNRNTHLATTAMNNQSNNALAGVQQQKFNYDVFKGQQGGAAYANAKV